MATRKHSLKTKKKKKNPPQFPIYSIHLPPVSQNIRKYDHHDTFHVKYCFFHSFLKTVNCHRALDFFFDFFKKVYFHEILAECTHKIKRVSTRTHSHTQGSRRARLCKALQLEPVFPPLPTPPLTHPPRLI